MAERLREIAGQMCDMRDEVEQFKDDLDAMREEEETKRDNMEDRFGMTDRFYRQEEIADQLSDAYDAIESIYDELVDVTFTELIDAAEKIEEAVE